MPTFINKDMYNVVYGLPRATTSRTPSPSTPMKKSKRGYHFPATEHRRNINLNDKHAAIGRKIGKGNLSLGIRIAIEQSTEFKATEDKK